MNDDRIMTVILPEAPAGLAHVSRHNQNAPIEAVDLDEAARIVLAAVIQGHRVEKTTDTASGIIIAITERCTPIQNRFGIAR